jgi:hypothetical protein
LQTVAERLSQELGVDATPEHLHELPPLAAVVPVPAWAKAEAKALGLKLDGTIQQPAPKASKKAQKQRKSKHDRK